MRGLYDYPSEMTLWFLEEDRTERASTIEEENQLDQRPDLNDDPCDESEDPS